MAFSDIFKLNKVLLNSQEENLPSDSIIIGDDSIKKDETYHQYGLRICGRVTGSQPALTPYLSKIYNEEKRQQHKDEATQLRLKQQLNEEITLLDGDISKKENKKSCLEVKSQDLNDKIIDANERLSLAKSKDGEVNKMARMKLIIGTLILLLLTIYLFIFYSSTFYSAFLYQPNPDSDISLGSAMLNAKAYSEAIQLGFGSFIFIITAPIIFLGLGYSLHFFMVQKGGTKWFKIGALLFITLAFDCILAYKIGELMYNAWAERQWEDVAPFTMDMAIQDINSWAVIFCGFIVYLIWGIVFDMIMTAYEDLRSNKYEINQLNAHISDFKNKLANIKQEIVNVNGEINNLQNKKKGIQDKINNSILVDYTKIRTALSDFFAGWVNMMSALGHSSENQAAAKQIYDDTITQLFG